MDHLIKFQPNQSNIIVAIADFFLQKLQAEKLFGREMADDVSIKSLSPQEVWPYRYEFYSELLNCTQAWHLYESYRWYIEMEVK